MADWKDIQEAREQRRVEAQYKEEMREFAEDMGLIPEEEYQPEQKRYDPNDSSMQNFLLGMLGPSIDSAREWKQEGSVDYEALQEEQDAFLEQQAVADEQRFEEKIAAGFYPEHPLAQMAKWEREQHYRQNARDRELARAQRDYDAKQRAKRRAQRRKELGME